MELKIYKGKLDFDPNPEKTTTNNYDWHEVVLVEFPNCISSKTGLPFKWMPTYNQLKLIKEELDNIEKLNKRLRMEHVEL